MKLPGMWLRHRVTVEPYEGDSGVGPLFGDEVTVRCFLEQKTRLVRAPDGREVTSGATFYCRLDAVSAPPESRVTLPDGRQTTVINQARNEGRGLPLPDHLEVQLV
ncbi:hypothetical protein ACFV3F_03500 [Streptomyces sp. NPDC059717]|uniref:hypothetical protein n=1 Tax=Streptomyces sp. NPDC059717 TaxID=3346922 RepID=UPI003695BEBF